MGNIGRFFCVALPSLLCIGSLIAMLVAGLAGVTDKSLYIFEVNTQNLSISPASIANIGSSLTSRSPEGFKFHDTQLLQGDGAAGAAGAAGVKSDNITAADLGLYKLYDISLWGYCYQTMDGSRSCTKAEFDWASKQFNKTTSTVSSLATATGQKVELPKEITDAMTAFGTLTKWTEVVFIIAYIALAIEIVLGFFANCSRAVSCVTWIVAGVASTAVVAAATMATVLASLVVGAVEATAKFYGIKADINTRYLATVWIGAALALAAGFFWLFTICCCKPEHRSSRRSRHRDEAGEKLIPTGSYVPIQENGHNGFHNQNAHSYGAPRYPSGPRSNLAYEPYSNRG